MPDPDDPRGHSTDSVSNPNSPYYKPDHPRYDAAQDSSSPTYIDQRGTSDTGEEVEERAEERVDAEEEDRGWLGQLLGLFTHGDEVSETSNEDMNAQAEQLAQGMNTRPSPIMMCANYLGTPHPELNTMVTEDGRRGRRPTAGNCAGSGRGCRRAAPGTGR